MPLDKGKLQKLYSTLQQGGYTQSYAEFEKGFAGNNNYPNRKKVYDLLTAHGADIGSSYEEFMGKMQTSSRPQQRTQAPAPAPKPRAKAKPRGGGMTAAERAQFIKNAQDIVNHSRANTNRTLNQIAYTTQKMKHKNVGKVHLGYGKRTGGNGNVMVKHKDGTITEDNGYSPQLNQALGNTYVTESGNEYDAPTGADFEQTAIDNQKTLVAQYNSERSVPGRLKSAYEMRDELEKKLEARRAELEKQREGRGTVANVLQDMGNIYAADKMGGVNPYSDEMRGYENDPEYMSLMSSLRKVNSSIQTLEAIKTGKGNSYWQGLKDILSNGYTFNDGLPEMRDATAVINAQKHLPSINKKLKSGKPLTHEEQVAYDVLRANVFDNDVQGQYQDQLGAWYRAGSATGTNLDFMKDIMLTGGGATSMTKGVYNGIVKKVTEALAKRGIENGAKAVIAKGVLKATGIAAGTTAAGAMVTNTTGFGRVGAETATNVAGQVGRDKDGNFTVEGNQSLLHGFVNAERDMIGENQSEMFGEFIPGGGKYIKKGLEKIGLSKISGALTSIGNKQWYKQYSNLLKAGGWNGLPGEAIEEYEGMLFDALTGNGEQAWQQIKDPKTHIDIWLGCATTGALLGAVPTAVQIHHTAQYYRYKHATDSSDKVAAFRMTQAKWEPIKDIFDNTDNEHMADAVMNNVVNNKDLSQPEKVAALNYVRNLTKMRGYNIGTANNSNEESDPNVEAQNEAYGKGYNATDATSMNDARNRLAAAQQKLDGIFGENTNAQQILDAKKEDGSPYFTANDRKAAQAVVNAKQEYEGMMQRVRDDIDDEVQQTGAIYDSRTNDQGVIQSATLKAQNPDGTDKKVYITSGNVVMTDDGKSVDREKSDMSIVVVDDEGKVQMISPDELFSLDTPIDGAQAKQQAIDAIQQSKAQEAADKINGKVNLTAGNTYTLTDNTGQQIEATIVADSQTGAVQNPDGTINVSMNGKVVPMDVNTLQQMVDNTNMQRAEQGDEEDTGDAAAMQQPTEPSNTEQTGDEGGTVTPEGAAVPTYPGSVVAPDMSEPHQWQVDDTFTIDNGGVPVRGQVTGIDADGVEIYTESPINGKKMQVISPDELQSMVSEINGKAVGVAQEDAAAVQQPTEQNGQPRLVSRGTEQSGVNGEQAQEQAPQTQEQAQPQQTEEAQGQQTEEPQQPQRAIDRIPSHDVDDGKGKVRTVHDWEQAEPGDTYDALSEIYHGNADRVKKGVQNRISAIDKKIKATQKQMDAIDNSDYFDAVAAQGEKYDQLQQQKAALEQQKKYWQGVQNVPVSRRAEQDKRTEAEKAAAKAARQKAEQEALEKARQERERVNGVPDVVNDTPSDARQRGFRNVNGMVVNRQGNTEGVTGRESSVKFSSKDTAKGKVKVIEADQLQPSHVSGQRNPQFFIDEAQPKDRTDTVSSMAAAKIASNLNPEEITGDGSAYQFSAPTVNSRGEVIQGNNRSDALKLMYSTPAFKPAQDAYKQYIIDHAADFGFTPEYVEKINQMQHPVMVNELDVPDDEAIRLGQMRASDNESGGIERIDPVTTSQKLGAKVGSYANILLSSPDEDASLSDVLMQNGAKTVHWLSSNGIISNTAAQSAFDRKGNLTPEARMDLLNILKQSLFQGGVSDLPTMFDKLPAKAQKAILNTFMRDFDSAESERILPEIQKAIEAWYGCAMSNEAFAKAPNYKSAKAAMHDWTLQTNLLDDNMPSDKFSNFAMELACRLQGCSMRETQQSLNDFFDLVQGKSQGDLFGGTTMGEQADRQESIRRIFNIEYKPISNNNGKTGSNAVADNGSQSGEGRQGSPTDGKGRERAESGSGSANGAGGTESHDEEVDDRGDSSHRDYSIHSGDSLGATSSSEKKETERQGVNTEPSEKQKEAGNYKKGHIKVDGYDITIENPKGSTRSGKDASGKAWSVPMHYDYGYIKGTEGVDGDHIDVYLSDNPTSGNVYVVDQINQNDGSFDEHKVMYGFPSMEAAVGAYKSQYTDGWKVGKVTEVSRSDFKKWVESSHRKTKPFAEYKSMEAAAKQQRTEPSAHTGTNGVNGSHGVNGTDDSTLKAESKRKQFDPSVRKDLERFVGEAKGKGITIDWEHSEPENAYIPMKIAGKASFVGVTEQDSDTPMTFPSDRPIAIYDIAEGGDIPDATKIDKFETYVKEYNSSKSLIEGSDDYASMDDQYPYVSFKSVDAAAKFNDWLNAEGLHSDGSNVDMADSLLDEVAARNDISEHATMKAEELKGREVEDLRTLEKKERAQADTDEQLAKIAKGEKRDKLLNDVKAHRANAELAKRVREEKEKEAEDIWGLHRAPSRVGRLTKREIALRDALNDAVRETGIEVIEDVEEGQRVLDMANDALLDKSKKRALETVSPSLNGTDHQTVISSADGAKVLNNLDTLVKEYENSSYTKEKTFIGKIAVALGIPREKFKDKSSQYATFETKNGKIVTIRISNHNATASNLDVNGQEYAISIVVTNKPNAGITNDGDAHIVEYYYNAIKLRKAEGKPLADIVRCIKQALYSGEFKDTTGLAERQEVNAADIVREQRVYHGSGADFDAFDNSHMGEGEGVQAHGWGTYVTKSESVGEKYAVKSDKATGLKRSELESNISRAEEQLSYLRGEVKAEKEKEIKEWKDELANLDGSKWLYTVEIPDDTGNNYIEEKQSLQDLKRGDVSERIDKAMDEYFGVKDSFYSWRLPGWAMREEFIRLAKGRHPEMSRGEADRKFSEVLSSAGVVGVHYDGRKDGDCYVIFNDKDLKITGKVKFFRTPNGEAYGYTVGGKIYEDPRIASSDTPIHEYAHLWAAMLRKVNPKEWENVIKLMKDTWAWDYVKKLYPDLKAEDEIADEALAMFSGKRGAEQARKAMEEFMEESMDGKDDLKTAAKKGLMRLKEALSKFWKNVCDLLHVHFTSAEEVADRVMYDMLRGFKSDNIDRVYREDRDYSKEEDSQKDAVVRYRLADPDESAVLDDQPTVKVYRAMQLIDGKLYPPMAAKVNGSLVEPAEPGQWLRADEHPELAKNGLFTLNKGGKDASGKRLGSVPAAYNPYWHTSRSPLNDQFSSAYKRPNLVTVEVEIPKSELTSGYHADGAKDPVGEMSWHAGPVSSKLPKEKERKVILSRWCKIVRVVPDAEVADKVAGMLKGENISVPDNTVTPSLRRELEKRGVPITHTKMVEDWERKYPTTQSGLSREGNGAYSDDELSMINDPFVKMLGEKARTAKQRKAFAARERRSMAGAVKELAEKLHLDNVEIRSAAGQQLTEGATKQERRKARAKGYYDRKSGTIVINIDNHRDVEDAVQTLLHEAVAHYGLRQLFGSHFDTFLDNVYKAADMDVRQRITDLALRKYKGDFHVATEEYLASLAEHTNFEHMPDSFWSKIKTLFLKMLHSIGFDGFAGMGVTLSDNELRYILWRSYENLKEPGRYRSILGEAEDVAKQAELKVGNYGETDAAAQQRPTELEQEAAEGDGVAEKDYKPSGKGYFGNIYTQFKGKVMEGINFLSRVRGGALQGVWHRNGIGDIDLVWGNEGGGLCHILKKHINDKDFKNKADFANRLNDIINNGKVDFENDDKVVLKKDGYVVTIRKNIRERGKKIADENWVLTAYNKDAPATTTAPADGTHGSTAVAPGASSGAKLGKSSESGVNKGENVSEPSVWGKKDLLSKAEQVTEGISPELLFRDSIEDDDNTARVTYDMMANQKKNIIREAWQDSMINVRNLQKAVLKQRDETLKPYEDAYEEENRMHGKSKTEEEVFTRNYYDPLLDSVNALAKAAKVSVGDVVQYMMAKHGLERNEVFAERDAQAAWDEYQEKQKQRFAEYQNTHPNSNKTIADFMEKEYDDFYQQYREKDYSGLTELTGTDNVQDAEAEAKSIVSAMESKSDTSDLWQKTNAATKWTLKKAKDCGIVSMANYEQVRDMFDYYIPLRGWKDETADDIYDYVGIRNNDDDVFSPTVKKAHGRRSEADNPIAYIGSMAVSAIVQGNKNKVKQTFLSFVWNHPTNLVTVSDMWYRNYGTEQDPDWREEFPDIPEDATADKIASILDQFGKDMEALASQGMATKKKGRLKISVPIKKSQALEHHVKVSLNGKEYVMYINGNPRAAQALNGTRARRAAENSHESAALANVNRWLGQTYTSLSPSFTVSNLPRDYTMATALTFIKEGPDYARRFQGNMALLGGPTRMFWLMHKYKSGNLNMNNETERLFHEFITEGGETGYTSLKDIERYKVDMQKKWKRMNRSDVDPRELWHDFMDGVENVNRCIEDTVRFATYMTSRKGGKTVRESVTDAKNITLNFNRKGSGELGNSTFRHLYIFVNPAIQGLNTVASAVKHHPVRFSLAAGFIVSMGMMQPLLIGVAASIFGGGDGDDGDDWNPSDEYWNLPAWQRRNNFVFWIPGTHKFGMIPLGQEFRMLHGFGETLYSYTHDHADDNPALELASQAADLLPLDMTGNSGNPMVTLMPTLMQPIAQVAANTEFTGRPIYKDSEWNKYEPAWQKAYVGTPSFLVSLSKEINELTGGNDHRQGVLETFTANDIHWLKWANNPAIVDHLMKGYLGGPYSFVTGLGGIAWKAMSKGVAPDAQEIPVVNRIVTAPREKEQGGKQKLPDWYYDLSDENARMQNEFSGYKKDYMKGEDTTTFVSITKRKDFEKWQTVNAYIGAVRQIRTAMQYTQDPKEKAELQKNLDEVLAELKKLKDK